MKKCLIAGNDPQYVTGLGKEEHIKKLKALLKKYIKRLICCGFARTRKVKLRARRRRR